MPCNSFLKEVGNSADVLLNANSIKQWLGLSGWSDLDEQNQKPAVLLSENTLHDIIKIFQVVLGCSTMSF